MNTDRIETLDSTDCKRPGGEGREPLVVHSKLGSKLTPYWQKIIGRHPMARALRIAGLAIFTAVAFAWGIHREPAKPIPVPLPVAKDEANLEPRTVRVIQIYKTPGDQPADPPPVVDPVNAFAETETLASPTAPSSSPPAAALPPLQKTAMDICERVHMHKQFTNGGRSWRCVK
jgi:hypothetical protein